MNLMCYIAFTHPRRQRVEKATIEGVQSQLNILMRKQVASVNLL